MLFGFGIIVEGYIQLPKEDGWNGSRSLTSLITHVLASEVENSAIQSLAAFLDEIILDQITVCMIP